jgi:hypothetical protein
MSQENRGLWALAQGPPEESVQLAEVPLASGLVESGWMIELSILWRLPKTCRRRQIASNRRFDPI